MLKRSVFLVVAAQWAATALSADPLPSWNATAPKQAIVQFVEKVTKPGSASFVPVAERVATFDNDGALWSEQPAYFQLFFAIDRIKAMASVHPEWKTQEPFASVLKGDMKGMAASGEKGLMQIVAATHAGMTTEELQKSVTDWMATARHPKKRKALHIDGVSANARAAHLSAGQWLQDVHSLRRRHRFHAPMGREDLRHTARTGGGLERRPQIRSARWPNP